MTDGANFSGDEDGEKTRKMVGNVEVLYQEYPVGVWEWGAWKSSSRVSVSATRMINK